MIQSLLRSMELLEVLKEKNRNFSIAELVEPMDLPPSTVHRILQTFCEKKYVIRDDRSHTYRLGPALIPLGKAAARGIRLQDAAHGILAQLAKQTKEDAYLVIPVGNEGLVIEKVDGPSHLKVIEEFGYDPVFFVPDKVKTFAQLTQEEKAEISHRGKALREFTAKLETYLKK